MASKNKVSVKDTGWRRFKKNMGLLDNIDITVGVHAAEGAQDRDGITAAEVASIHEFGAPNAASPIPQRSFLRATMDEGRAKYNRLLEDVVTKTVKKNVSPIQRANRVGSTIRKDVINRIKSRIPPPLAQATVDRGRRADTPLLNTGQLVRSIKSIVRKKRGGF